MTIQFGLSVSVFVCESVFENNKCWWCRRDRDEQLNSWTVVNSQIQSAIQNFGCALRGQQVAAFTTLDATNFHAAIHQAKKIQAAIISNFCYIQLKTIKLHSPSLVVIVIAHINTCKHSSLCYYLPVWIITLGELSYEARFAKTVYVCLLIILSPFLYHSSLFLLLSLLVSVDLRN